MPIRTIELLSCDVVGCVVKDANSRAIDGQKTLTADKKMDVIPINWVWMATNEVISRDVIDDLLATAGKPVRPEVATVTLDGTQLYPAVTRTMTEISIMICEKRWHVPGAMCANHYQFYSPKTPYFSENTHPAHLKDELAKRSILLERGITTMNDYVLGVKRRKVDEGI